MQLPSPRAICWYNHSSVVGHYVQVLQVLSFRIRAHAVAQRCLSSCSTRWLPALTVYFSVIHAWSQFVKYENAATRSWPAADHSWWLPLLFFQMFFCELLFVFGTSWMCLHAAVALGDSWALHSTLVCLRLPYALFSCHHRALSSCATGWEVLKGSLTEQEKSKCYL